MTTAVATAPAAPAARLTVAEFAARYNHVRAELVKGVVKEITMPYAKHGAICLRIGHLILSYVDTHDLGYVASNDSWIQTGPDTVRGADVCYFSYDRVPRGGLPDGLVQTPPELVVEVRSPSDRWNDLFGKAVEYINAGVRVVVLLDPKTAAASVHRADELQQIYHNGDELTLPDVLPGFAVKVSRLFA